jgi:D-alanine-D-alanine ligase
MPQSLLKKPSPPFKSKKVLVLAGGWSKEREVSLSSGQGVMEALKNLGHRGEFFDPPRSLLDLIYGIESSFDGQGPEIIFNILHGHEVEDGILQGVLTLLNRPYTFSNVLGSALSMHKGIARDILSTRGVRCPEGGVVALKEYPEKITFFPHVCKPLGEGSTMGVHFVSSPQEQEKVFNEWVYGHELLVERYIPGREIQVAVFGGIAMGAVEITFEGPIFSYEAKYVKGLAQHLVPAPLPLQAYEEVLHLAELAHDALQCKGVTRSDFRYHETQGGLGTFYYLETNCQPGMTPLSLVPEIAAAVANWSYEDVVQWILEEALCAK